MMIVTILLWTMRCFHSNESLLLFEMFIVNFVNVSYPDYAAVLTLHLV